MFFLCEEDGIWERVEDEALRVGLRGGLYRVHALDLVGTAGEPSYWPVPRLLGLDPDGLLYIGMATAFSDRFAVLRKSIRGESSHGFGLAYRSSEVLRQRFPPNRLAYTLEFSAEPRLAEAGALQAYRDRFGELPPFNAQN